MKESKWLYIFERQCILASVSALAHKMCARVSHVFPSSCTPKNRATDSLVPSGFL